jgi:hypothetical protein
VFLGNVMPAVATVVNFTYKFGVALVAIFQPVFDFLTAGWRILGGFLMDVFDAVLTAGQALGTGLGFVVRTIGEAIDFITGGMFGADVKKAGADMMAVMIAGMAKPVLPMGGGPAAPVLDPGMFRAMADVIPDIGEAGGLEDITGKMIDGMIRALGETELARFGNQGGFKGIADAWKSAQMAAFRSPEEARRDKMFLEGLKNMREILVTLKEGLGGPGMME